VERARSIGIRVPIIPGVKPITTARQLQSIPREFHVDLPDELVACIQRAATPADAFRAGSDFTIRLCRDLLRLDIPGIHFYTMGKARDVVEVLKAIT
jgi:methylenetetrahydrofolate reductase (NADPH)